MPDTHLTTEPDSQALISAENLTVRFGGLPAIKNVNVSIGAGEIVTLIGPNGAGKSTLVRALLGLIVPTDGTITRRPNVRIGYVPQHVSVDDTLPLTVERFLRLGGRASQDQLEKSLAEVGALDVITSQFQKISGGERRRVLLARALLRNPDLLVLDEPTSGVDVTGQADIYKLIGSIRKAHNCGVLLVSHDLHLVMAETDQVLCLNGHVCCSGHPSHVSQDPAYLELFGHESAQGLAVYTHHHDHTQDHDHENADHEEPGYHGAPHG
jgi:zinc transport system ATP-binding protein